jgi:predicted AlkP superfamily pyrophosphatase or phosphodiesterase
MLATTITDELRLASNMRSKVVGIALKDRGAILPAGHAANAAYWLDDKAGKWISSTFYMNNLPKWVDDLNEKNLPQQYLSQDWTPLLDMSAYKASIADDNAFEGKWKGEASSSFPHFLPELQKEYGIGLIRATPFGNSLTKDMALAALRGEKLGQGKETDFLCLSFSSTDYVGHFYGVQAIETEDTYIRLDRDLAEIFKALDKEVGKNNYLVFLTADHAAVEAPEYLKSVKIPAGLFNPTNLEKEVKTFCQAKFGDSLVQTVVNQHIYLKETVLVQKKLNRLEVSEQIATAIRRKEGIAQVWTYNDFLHLPPSDDISRKVFDGFYEKRCGDVIYNLEPSWSEHEKTGTTHGSPYTYDTHVPLLFYGWNVPHGSTDMPLQIDDIAPTLSMMLQIRLPNGCTGKPIPFYKK